MSTEERVMAKPTDSHDPTHDRVVFRRVTWAGLVLNVALSLVKLAAGLAARSQALVADAVHSASDTVTDIAVLAGESWWSRPADENHPYGHTQLEAVVTLFIGASLVAVVAGLGLGAVSALRGGDFGVPGRGALGVALLSMAGKEWMYRWTLATGRRLDSVPLIANAWHHRSDALSSLPVALALAGTAVSPRLAFLDPLGGLLVCVFLLHAAWRIAWPALAKMLGAGATEAQIHRIVQTVLSHEAVLSTHRIRTRYLGCSRLAVDLHIRVDGRTSVREGHAVSEHVKWMILRQHPKVKDVIVHLEPHEGT